jgi:hypothetical protein
MLSFLQSVTALIGLDKLSGGLTLGNSGAADGGYPQWSNLEGDRHRAALANSIIEGKGGCGGSGRESSSPGVCALGVQSRVFPNTF